MHAVARVIWSASSIFWFDRSGSHCSSHAKKGNCIRSPQVQPLYITDVWPFHLLGWMRTPLGITRSIKVTCIHLRLVKSSPLDKFPDLLGIYIVGGGETMICIGGRARLHVHEVQNSGSMPVFSRPSLWKPSDCCAVLEMAHSSTVYYRPISTGGQQHESSPISSLCDWAEELGDSTLQTARTVVRLPRTSTSIMSSATGVEEVVRDMESAGMVWPVRVRDTITARLESLGYSCSRVTGLFLSNIPDYIEYSHRRIGWKKRKMKEEVQKVLR